MNSEDTTASDIKGLIEDIEVTKLSLSLAKDCLDVLNKDIEEREKTGGPSEKEKQAYTTTADILIEKLKEENARLKDEESRLRQEIEKKKNIYRSLGGDSNFLKAWEKFNWSDATNTVLLALNFLIGKSPQGEESLGQSGDSIPEDDETVLPVIDTEGGIVGSSKGEDEVLISDI